MIFRSSEIYRNPESIKHYKTVKVVGLEALERDCPLCRPGWVDQDVCDLNLNHFMIVDNQAPYDVWDMRPVRRHKMLVAKRHILSVSDMNRDEVSEMIRAIKTYTDAGFFIFLKPRNLDIMSVHHWHMHFIETENKKLKVDVTYS